jgi:hypothetical protein
MNLRLMTLFNVFAKGASTEVTDFNLDIGIPPRILKLGQETKRLFDPR